MSEDRGQRSEISNGVWHRFFRLSTNAGAAGILISDIWFLTATPPSAHPFCRVFRGQNQISEVRHVSGLSLAGVRRCRPDGILITELLTVSGTG